MSPRGATKGVPPRRKWAFLTYIAGDNNLSDAGLQDIAEMCNTGASEETYVGVEIDTYGEHTGSLRYEITPPDWSGKSYRTVIDRLPERDTGNPIVLKDFLNWGRSRFPADQTVVVIWNHGSGFRSVRRNIGYDDFGSSLDMPAIEWSMREAGIDAQNPVTILGFDACLMNMVEIVDHFHGLTRYIVGSQQTEPADGWPYHKVLGLMNRLPTPDRLARGIVDVYARECRRLGFDNITQSAVDLKNTPAVMTLIGRLGASLAPLMQAHPYLIKGIRMGVQSFEMSDYVDLIDLMRGLRRADVLGAAVHRIAAEIIEKTKASVIRNRRHGSGVKNAEGLSVWFPAASNLYYQYRAKYLGLNFASRDSGPTGAGWVTFLDAYHRY